jgi:hypothetical protein
VPLLQILAAVRTATPLQATATTCTYLHLFALSCGSCASEKILKRKYAGKNITFYRLLTPNNAFQKLHPSGKTLRQFTLFYAELRYFTPKIFPPCYTTHIRDARQLAAWDLKPFWNLELLPRSLTNTPSAPDSLYHCCKR